MIMESSLAHSPDLWVISLRERESAAWHRQSTSPCGISQVISLAIDIAKIEA
jgi:hypothetical protein